MLKCTNSSMTRQEQEQWSGYSGGSLEIELNCKEKNCIVELGREDFVFDFESKSFLFIRKL